MWTEIVFHNDTVPFLVLQKRFRLSNLLNDEMNDENDPFHAVFSETLYLLTIRNKEKGVD